MPTKEQIESVIEQIESLQGLSPEERNRAMADMLWEGFTEAQKRDVELRVSEGESPDFWMDGIEPNDAPVARAKSEIRSIKESENNRTIGPTDDLGLGPDWTVIGTVDLGKWEDWSEVQRLAVLQEMVDWDEVEPGDKRHIIEREVDLSRVSPADQREIIGEVWNRNDVAPAGRAAWDSPPASAPTDDREVRPLTRELIECCQLDVWPGIATIVDFGIDTDRHLGALQFAIRDQLVTPQELDAAMGSGPKLTEIARRGRNPYGDVTFKTSWDDLPMEPDHDAEDHADLSPSPGSIADDQQRGHRERPPSPGEIAEGRDGPESPEPGRGTERGRGR